MEISNQQVIHRAAEHSYMRTLSFILLSVIILCFSNMVIASDKEQLQKLLNSFLTDNTQSPLEKHTNFWADDLIYTSSAGERFDKNFIVDGIKNNNDKNVSDNTSEADKNTAPTYSAEDIDIRLYGSTAIVAFKLIADTNILNSQEKIKYFNTGTFLKRNDIWQAVAWQATKIPVIETTAVQ